MVKFKCYKCEEVFDKSVAGFSVVCPKCGKNILKAKAKQYLEGKEIPTSKKMTSEKPVIETKEIKVEAPEEAPEKQIKKEEVKGEEVKAEVSQEFMLEEARAIVSLPFQIAGNLLEIDKLHLSDEQSIALGSASQKLLNKYASGLGGYALEITFAITLGSVILEKYMIYKSEMKIRGMTTEKIAEELNVGSPAIAPAPAEDDKAWEKKMKGVMSKPASRKTKEVS